MKLRSRLAITLGLVAVAACSKAKPDELARTDPWAAAPGDAGAAPVDDDPWAARPPKNSDVAPPTLASKMGAAAGEQLAKMEGLGTEPAATGKPVNPARIAKTGIATGSMRGFAGVEQTGFRVAYAASPNQVHEQFRTILAENQVFERVADGLNKTVRLPRVVDIQLTDCGVINAFYDPNGKRIIVCYELMTYFVNIFKSTASSDEQLGQAVVGATVFGFYHEAGHALIHQLDLPAVGREEDAVDQLATLILLAAGDDGVAMALSGAYWFQLQQKAGAETPFWDEHAFDGQRFYNIMCLIYGSDPQKYGSFVADGNLPKARAARCQEEYGKIQASWRKLLEPHLTNDAAEEIDYTPSVPADETTPDPAPTVAVGEPAGDDEDDEDPAPRPTPVSAGHAIPCEQVAEKAVALIGVEAEQQLGAVTPAERQAALAEIQAGLPAYLEQFLAQCAQEDWPDADRQCVLDAATLDRASRCGAGS